MKWLEIDQDNLHPKFVTSNVDFNRLNLDSLSSRKPAHAIVEKGYPSKNSYYTDIGPSSVKTVAHMH